MRCPIGRRARPVRPGRVLDALASRSLEPVILDCVTHQLRCIRLLAPLVPGAVIELPAVIAGLLDHESEYTSGDAGAAGGDDVAADVGTCIREELASQIKGWVHAGAVDGFNLQPDRLIDSLDVIVDELVPILRRRGLYRHDYETETLRGHFRAASPTPDF